MGSRKVLFLDRDGVINEECQPFPVRNRCKWVPGIFSLCKQAQAKHYDLVVVTNQGGIGMGYLTMQDYLEFTEWMRYVFLQRGIYFRDVLSCPYHPDAKVEEYKRSSKFRKPSPGMLNWAIHRYGYSRENSVMLGDRWTDIEAGVRAGIGNLILYSPKDTIRPECENAAVIQVDTLLEAAKILP